MKKSKSATKATGGQNTAIRPVTGSTSSHSSGQGRSKSKAVNR